jgi:hypothetical protein
VINWRTSIIGAPSSDGRVATPRRLGSAEPRLTPCSASHRHHSAPLRTARRSSSSPTKISTRIMSGGRIQILRVDTVSPGSGPAPFQRTCGAPLSE